MIFGKKDLEESNKKIEHLNQDLCGKFEDLNILVKKNQELSDARFNAIEVQLQQLSFKLSNELEKTSQQLDAVDKARENIERSTRTFADVQRKIEKSVDEQLGAAIRDGIDRLKLDITRYDDIKKNIEQVGLMLQSVTTEIVKFKSIAAEVRKADFELVKYAHELEKVDSEKIRLLKQVDDLQRMIAKMRRGQR